MPRYRETYWVVVDSTNDLIWLGNHTPKNQCGFSCVFQTEEHLINFFRMDNGWFKAEVDTKNKIVNNEWNYKEIPTADLINYL